MNILYIFPQNVIPPIDGGKISIYYPIKYLADAVNIHIFFVANKYEVIDIDAYYNLGVKSVKYIRLDKSDTVFKVITNIGRKIPFKMKKYHSKEGFRLLEEIVKKNNIDIILCSSPHVFEYAYFIKKKYNVPIIFREHNVEYQLVFQYCKLEKNWIKKAIALWQYLKTKKYEVSCWERSDKILFISDSDLEEAINACASLQNRFTVVYDGFELKYSGVENRTFEENSFIFSGSVRTLQNRINLSWFIEKIWKPFIKEQKEFKLYITGNSDEDIAKHIGLKKDELIKYNIYNLGFVENIDDVIRSKQFFVSPTVIGSGIRLKVLHALSLGVPVFLTEMDYKMVKHFSDMENVIKFSDLKEFALKVKMLKEDNSLYSRISQNCYRTIKTFLNWGNYRDALLNSLKSLSMNEIHKY